MKKLALLLVMSLLFITPAAQALSWAYPFVVWNGKVYEVKQEEILEEQFIDHVIGKVQTRPNDMSGRYFGNASNYYPKGTKYYSIKGINTSTTIAIRNDDKWLKAVYIHKAPFHIMNILFNKIFLTALTMLLLLIIINILRKNYNNRI